MIEIIGKILLIAGPLAFLYKYYRDFQRIEQKLAEEKTKNVVKDDLAAMAEKAKVSSEEIRDFNDAVDTFNKDNK